MSGVYGGGGGPENGKCGGGDIPLGLERVRFTILSIVVLLTLLRIHDRRSKSGDLIEVLVL